MFLKWMVAITPELRFSLINGLKTNDRGPKFSLSPPFRFNFCVFKEYLLLLSNQELGTSNWTKLSPLYGNLNLHGRICNQEARHAAGKRVEIWHWQGGYLGKIRLGLTYPISWLFNYPPAMVNVPPFFFKLEIFEYRWCYCPESHSLLGATLFIPRFLFCVAQGVWHRSILH